MVCSSFHTYHKRQHIQRELYILLYDMDRLESGWLLHAYRTMTTITITMTITVAVTATATATTTMVVGVNVNVSVL